MMSSLLKNSLLISTYVISMLPVFFYGSCERLNLGLFFERDTRIDFFLLYYGISINYLIMAYCIHYPNNVHKSISRFILILCALDMVHLIIFAKQGLGILKIVFAITLLIVYEFYKKRYGKY